MKDGLFLADVLDTSKLKRNYFNIISAPCGCGKTTAAINVIASLASSPRKALYLIDSRNGCNQLAKKTGLVHPCVHYVEETCAQWGERPPDAITVTTYAKLGQWLVERPNFLSFFEIVICDEAHNLYYFSKFSPEPNHHSRARDAIHRTIFGAATLFIAITATPEGMKAPEHLKHFVPVPTEQLRRYEDKQTIPYAQPEKVISKLPPGSVGAMYVGRITEMEKWEDFARTQGRKPICIWSIFNEEHPMTAEQMAAREYILENESLPPQYDFFIFNASCETAINIRSKVDFCMIHHTNSTHITQARGRFRGDLECLYLLDKQNGCVEVDDCFLGHRLDKKEKMEMRATLHLKDNKGHPLPWKELIQLLVRSGYAVAESGKNERPQYLIISKI